MRLGSLLSIAASLVLVAGCATNFINLPLSQEQSQTTLVDNSEDELAMSGPGVAYRGLLPSESMAPDSATGFYYPKRDNAYSAAYTHKSLNEYAEQLSMDMIRRMHQHPEYTSLRVGVASFVELNHHLKGASVLGNQLAESFIAEMQAFGIAVVDFKATGVLEVSERGDFAFSRNVYELASDKPMDYVLSGTLVHNTRGAAINARILSLRDGVVIASAKGFVPRVVLEGLTPDYTWVQ